MIQKITKIESNDMIKSRNANADDSRLIEDIVNSSHMVSSQITCQKANLQLPPSTSPHIPSVKIIISEGAANSRGNYKKKTRENSCAWGVSGWAQYGRHLIGSISGSFVLPRRFVWAWESRRWREVL